MRNPPDRAVAVFRYQQGAVMRDGHANGPPPYLGIVDDKAGDKVLVLAGRHSVLEANPDHLVARAFGPVPRAVLGCEPITAIFQWKCSAVVECQPERRRVRLNENVGNGDFALQVRTFAGVPRVWVAADIEPGPAVERPFAHPGNVVRHQIVSHPVTLIGGAIHIAVCGMDGETHTITDTGREDTGAFSIGIERQHGGAVGLARPARAERVFIATRSQSSRRASDTLSVIALRTDRYQHPLVVGGGDNVPGRVSVAMRQSGDDGFRF